jgi:CubicO group peptidase (beta-lactamase class C family)
MTLSRRAIFGIAALPLLARDAHAVTTNGALLDDASIAHLLTMTSVPGIQLAVLDDWRIADARCLGRLRDDGADASMKSLFQAASLTKPVFAVSVLELARRGAIDLDRPLQTYLPFTADAKARLVTPRHVLAHATGFPNWRGVQDGDLASAFVPGTNFRYSGEGYFVLQRVVEHVTRRTAASWIRELVLQPACMTRTTFDPDDDVAWPHDLSGACMTNRGPGFVAKRRSAGPAKPLETWNDDERRAAAAHAGDPPIADSMIPNMAGSLWSTASDYARFLIHARGYDELRTPATRVKGTLAWSVGWGLEQGDGALLGWQWGDAPGVKSFFALDLDRGRGIVVLTNGQAGAKVYQPLVRGWLGRNLDSLLWV